MKIGIITMWWSRSNYGQLLQHYALQTVLKCLGHDPILIRYIPKMGKVPSFIQRLKNNVKGLLRACRAGRQQDEKRDFDGFREQYFHKTKQKYSYLEELQKKSPQVDMYLCGSDQIWNHPREIKKREGIIRSFFLDFGSSQIPKASYAASFGGETFDDEYYTLVSPLLSNFKCVTVREVDGLDICRTAGRLDAEVVLDPTLLLDKSDYSKIMKKVDIDSPFVLVYAIGNKSDIPYGYIENQAKQYRLEIIYVTAQGLEIKKSIKTIKPTIQEWLYLISQAEMIFTNSFHGAIFSIIFNRDFVFLPLIGEFSKMNSRVVSLFNKLSLSDQIYNGAIHSYRGVNYTEVNAKLKEERERSLSILKNRILL